MRESEFQIFQGLLTQAWAKMARPFWQYDSDNTLLAFRKLHASTNLLTESQVSIHGNPRLDTVQHVSPGQKLQAKYKYTSSAAQGGGGSFRIGTYRRAWLLWITDGRATPLMDWKVVGVVFFGVVTVVAVVTWSVTSPTTAGCSVV